LATQRYRAGEKLAHGFRPVSGPSLHSPRFSGDQYAPSLLERRKRFLKEKPTREYLSDKFGIDSFSAGILMMYFDLVVMLNISFIPTIEFPYSTGDPCLSCPLQCRGNYHSLDVALLQESLLNIELLSGQRSPPSTSIITCEVFENRLTFSLWFDRPSGSIDLFCLSELFE
jgi:hypothetical protein